MLAIYANDKNTIKSCSTSGFLLFELSSNMISVSIQRTTCSTFRNDRWAIFTNLEIGKHSVIASYDGINSAPVVFNVNKISAYDMTVNASDTFYGNDVSAVITLPEDATGAKSAYWEKLEHGRRGDNKSQAGDAGAQNVLQRPHKGARRGR